MEVNDDEEIALLILNVALGVFYFIGFLICCLHLLFFSIALLRHRRLHLLSSENMDALQDYFLKTRAVHARFFASQAIVFFTSCGFFLARGAFAAYLIIPPAQSSSSSSSPPPFRQFPFWTPYFERPLLSFLILFPDTFFFASFFTLATYWNITFHNAYAFTPTDIADRLKRNRILFLVLSAFIFLIELFFFVLLVVFTFFLPLIWE